MICFQTSGVGVNDLFRNSSLSKCTTLVFDSFAISAVDDFGLSSSLLLIMLDLLMSKSSRSFHISICNAVVHMPHYTGSGVFSFNYLLKHLYVSMLYFGYNLFHFISQILQFSVLYFSYIVFDFISQILQLSRLYFVYNVFDFTLVNIRLVVMLIRRNNNITSYTDSQTPAALTRYTSPRGITTSQILIFSKSVPPCNI